MTRRIAVSLLAAVLAVAGCTERPQGPLEPAALAPAAPTALIDGPGIDVAGVLRLAGPPAWAGPRHVSKLVRAAEGGTVELNGYRVEIPAGALPHDATITIDLPRGGPLGQRLLAEFGPHGIHFNEPVTLTFPLRGVLLDGGALEVARWENGGWTSLGGSVSDDGASLSSTTPHFSTYAGKYVMAGG